MLDRKFIVENAALVKENCLRRNSKADIDRFVALEMDRRKKQQDVDELNRKANEKASSIGKDPADQREALKAEGRALREQCERCARRIGRHCIGRRMERRRGFIHPEQHRAERHLHAHCG